jgi:hypothetical protein
MAFGFKEKIPFPLNADLPFGKEAAFSQALPTSSQTWYRLIQTIAY